jgi:hypothetical protein
VDEEALGRRQPEEEDEVGEDDEPRRQAGAAEAVEDQEDVLADEETDGEAAAPAGEGPRQGVEGAQSALPRSLPGDEPPDGEPEPRRHRDVHRRHQHPEGDVADGDEQLDRRLEREAEEQPAGAAEVVGVEAAGDRLLLGKRSEVGEGEGRHDDVGPRAAAAGP